MRQWMLRITNYAECLLDDLEELDWPESVKAMQRNWIGRSQGMEIRFPVVGSSDNLIVFATRPETLFGATYCVLAPEHALLPSLVTPGAREVVQTYIRRAETLSEAARSDARREKSGAFTGTFVRNPANGRHLPVWVADYVLGGYGTGTIMAVPAHDARDHEFARFFGLPIIRVVDAADGHDVTKAAYDGDGVMVNSDFLDGMTVAEARRVIIEWLEQHSVGTAKVTYRLRDWLFSRQRYWGEPIPVLHLADGSIVSLPEDTLPLLPPKLQDYKPTQGGEPPLPADWLCTTVPGTEIRAMRETNTMPQWAGGMLVLFPLSRPAQQPCSR